MGQNRRPVSREGGPLVSVVVCSYSRERLAQFLAAIASLEAQTYQPREIVVVVDYNPALAEELRGSLSGNSVRVLENEESKGLSGARNTGVKAAAGDIVAFIDDDASAEPTWLEELVGRYSHDGVVGVGGAVMPAWEGGSKPQWLPEEFLWVMGCSYRGLPDGGPVRNAIGCNMSFKAEVFREVGGFDPSVGRLGSVPLGCEETELSIRALNRWPDKTIEYFPPAIVHHHVPRPRQTFGYFVSRCFAEGVSKAVVSRLAGAPALESERLYALRTLGGGVARNLASALIMKDIAGSLGRAGAIGVGFLTVTLGFVVGSVQLRSRTPRRRVEES